MFVKLGFRLHNSFNSNSTFGTVNLLFFVLLYFFICIDWCKLGISIFRIEFFSCALKTVAWYVYFQVPIWLCRALVNWEMCIISCAVVSIVSHILVVLYISVKFLYVYLCMPLVLLKWGSCTFSGPSMLYFCNLFIYESL